MSPLIIEPSVSTFHHQSISTLTLAHSLQAYTPPPSIPKDQSQEPPPHSDHSPDSESAAAAPQPSSSTSQPGESSPSCANCGTASTPLWRRDADGNTICNACGELFCFCFFSLRRAPGQLHFFTVVVSGDAVLDACLQRGVPRHSFATRLFRSLLILY